MPRGLKRYYGDDDLHFITFSCYRRQPLVGSPRASQSVSQSPGAGPAALSIRRAGLRGHARTRSSAHQRAEEKKPFHGHTGHQAWFRPTGFGATASPRNLRQATLFEHAPQHIWQARFYDFNVWTDRKRIEKLQYMHRNPVKRGLVESPEMWRWSSYRSYAFGECGLLRLNEWGALQLKVHTPEG